MSVVYFVRLGPEGPVKIGTTTRFRRRLKQLAEEYGVEVRVLGVRDGGLKEEREHHQKFAALRLGREYGGGRERFSPHPDLIGYIKRECREPDLFDEVSTYAVRLDLSPQDHERLERCASRIGLSMSSCARMAVLRWIQAEEAQQKG